jgi:hypothetical protein
MSITEAKMTLRERLYGQLLSSYGPPPLQYSVVAVSIGAKGRELPRVSAAVEAIILLATPFARVVSY